MAKQQGYFATNPGKNFSTYRAQNKTEVMDMTRIRVSNSEQ